LSAATQQPHHHHHHHRHIIIIIIIIATVLAEAKRPKRIHTVKIEVLEVMVDSQVWNFCDEIVRHLYSFDVLWWCKVEQLSEQIV